jgi:hypothetical protein
MNRNDFMFHNRVMKFPHACNWQFMVYSYCGLSLAEKESGLQNF